MRGLSILLLLCLLVPSGAADASYLGLGDEVKPEKRKGGVVFPITNKTNRNINQVFGWVYGYNDITPYKPVQASNPNTPAIKVSPGAHLPGKTALYWFQVPAYHLKMKKFGVVVYDASVFFDR